MSIIDENGYRANVGIILVNSNRRLFLGRRLGQNAWQFPQGGFLEGETPEEALYRELKEEIGLEPDAVEIKAVTPGWLSYQLPKSFIRHHSKPVCIGQKQKWFLLQFTGEDQAIQLDHSEHPEFDHWRWVSYWYPLRQVVDFKRRVYRKALEQFAPVVFESAKQK